jgi:hypothetical protein
VNEAVDGFTGEFQTTDDFVYPTFGGTIARTPSSLTSFAMMVPLGNWTLGVGYARPIHMKIDLLHAGFRQRIDTQEENPDERIAFAIQTRINNRIEVATDNWALALSSRIGPYLTAGVSASRMLMDFNILAGYNIDGIMIRSGISYPFNNEADAHYNKLHSDASGGYHGDWWTVRGGLMLAGKADRSWRLGVDVSWRQETVLNGSLHLLVDEFPALVLEPEEGEDPFDVSKVDVSEITRTYPNEYIASNELRFHVPSGVTVTLAKGGGLRPSMSGTLYMESLFGYDIDITEKSIYDTSYTTRTYGRGLDLKYGAYLGIHPGWFIFGVGGIVAEDYVHGYVDDTGEPEQGGTFVVIPRLDLGLAFNISPNLKYELLIAGLPEDVLRMGITYEF